MDITAGLLMYRFKPELEVFIGHMGGPLFENQDDGSWTIPKGGIKDEDDGLKDTAIREFEEETSIPIESTRDFIYLGYIIQRSGKKVYAWAFERDFEGEIESNMIEDTKEGPFPELDRAEYFDIEGAKVKLMESQVPFLDRLVKKLQVK